MLSITRHPTRAVRNFILAIPSVLLPLVATAGEIDVKTRMMAQYWTLD